MEPLLIPRQAVAAIAVPAHLLGARRDVVDNVALLALLLGIGDGPRKLVIGGACPAQDLLDVEPAAQECQSRIHLAYVVLRVRCCVMVRSAGLGALFDLVAKDERSPAIPEKHSSGAEQFIGNEPVAPVAKLFMIRSVHS